MRVNDKIDARFLERNRIAWRNVMSNVEGAVTAIYYDTGWGRYIGNSELATRDGVQLGPAPTRAVIIAAGCIRRPFLLTIFLDVKCYQFFIS